VFVEPTLILKSAHSEELCSGKCAVETVEYLIFLGRMSTAELMTLLDPDDLVSIDISVHPSLLKELDIVVSAMYN
jgi:hypothetical protein